MWNFPAKVSHFVCNFDLAFCVLIMADKVESEDPSGQKSGSTAPEAKEIPTTSTAHTMDEVFRVNHLLQIEDLDWTRQLKQAVSNLLLFT